MLKLNKESLLLKNSWEQVGVQLPSFDLENLAQVTATKPSWIHFGAGNIFRGFMANLQQKLLDTGLADTGIIAVETFDTDIIEQIYQPHDNLSLLVKLNPDGQIQKKLSPASPKH